MDITDDPPHKNRKSRKVFIFLKIRNFLFAKYLLFHENIKILEKIMFSNIFFPKEHILATLRLNQYLYKQSQSKAIVSKSKALKTYLYKSSKSVNPMKETLPLLYPLSHLSQTKGPKVRMTPYLQTR